jgi:hypothetical protein
MNFPRLVPLLAFGLPLVTGACGVPVVLTAASYGADGVSYAETGKSTTDHLASMVTKKDCAFWRVFRSEQVCREREGNRDPYQVDYDQPSRQPSEDGVSYAPPLRSSADTPAASWTAETYEAGTTEPTATAPVGAGPTVPADASPAPPSVTPKAPVSKLTAPRTVKAPARAKPVRKASRGQAASAP